MCGINYGSFPVVRHAGLDLASTAELKSRSHRASLGMTLCDKAYPVPRRKPGPTRRSAVPSGPRLSPGNADLLDRDDRRRDPG